VLSVFCWDGVNDYKTILESKKPFKKMEEDKVSLHIHYTFYGIRGVRLLFIPSPLSVIFNDLAVFEGMTAHVDTAEKLNISNSFKGKDLFSDSGGYMDFSGIMLIIGSLLALLYGYDATRNQEYLRMLTNITRNRKLVLLIILARVVLLNLVFWALSGLALLWLFIFGINAANIFYLCFVLGLNLVITFFVFLGAAISSLKRGYIALGIFYFLLVLFIPWIIQKAVYVEAKKSIKEIHQFEYEMFKYVMDFEKRFYERFGVWKSGKVAPNDIKTMIQSGQEIEYKKLRENEKKRINGISKRIRIYQSLAAFLPSTFYLSSNKELSSKGFQNFIDFYRYAYEMKFKFIKFYIDRKFYRQLPKSGVEPFIKNNEDLFYGQSRLPPNFFIGVTLSVLYIICLSFILFRIHARKTKKESKNPQIDFEEGQNSIFVLCKDNQIKDEIFRYYEQQNAICLDKINTKDFRFYGISLEYMFNYFCSISGVDKEIAGENLALLGITDLKRESHEHDTILKIYTAIKIAVDSEFIVLNDFLKKESRNLEENVFELLTNLEMEGKKIIYLSTEMYFTKVSLDKKVNVEDTVTFPLFMDKITVR
jgi:hypothetical protein